MGKHNSSVTRVEPVFSILWNRVPPEPNWVSRLLDLGTAANHQLNRESGELIPDHQAWWGAHEKRLDPPKSLLQYLVSNIANPSSEGLWGKGETRDKRKLLVARDSATIAEGLTLLKTRTAPGVWYVLEGRSAPDVYLETESSIIVIEGKRTERSATSVTTWMQKRSQMLRHMDAAWEIHGAKSVYGLMIVEGDGGAEATTPSEHWLKESNHQVLEQTLEDSLPHRSAEEHQQIATGYLGVTTWQRVCSEFNIPWPPYHDVP